MILPILILSVGQLLDMALGFAQILLSICIAPVFSIKLRFKLTNSCVHLGHCFFATLESVLLSFIKATLGILTWGSRSFLSLSSIMAVSCSALSSSAKRAASTIAL